MALAVLAGPASAQATRTWVSGVGDDANPCSRTAPCKTFAGAISKTGAGGEINCIDQGAYGSVTITKSITLSCEGVTAGVLASSTNGIIINAATTDTVILRGLDINGAPPASPGLNGIRVLAAAAVHVEDCIIQNFTGVEPNGVGLKIATAAGFKFSITRTTFINNGNGSTGAGIQVIPTAGAVSGLLDRVVATRNVFGVAVDGTAGASGINITVNDSTISNNSQSGIIAVTGANGAGIMIGGTTVVNNAVGVQTAGAGAVIRVGSSTITGNGTGVSGGAVQSYGNNQLNGNGADGVFAAVPGGLH
jgi:hypothetical protein